MGLLLPDTGLLFWMVLAFGIVFGVLAKYGFPVITQMVEERKTYIDDSLKAAHEANTALAEIKVSSEKILAEAREQQVNILNEAATTRDKIIAEAKKEAQLQGKLQLDEARAQIQAEKEEAIRQVRREIASLSVDIAGKVVRQQLSKEKEQMDMIDRLLDEVTKSN
ncbi:MAG: F0F1 ATP synthase subunit B [Bacteroidaceae bacterium]|nr:F0F1 ATP synthase subunit B [Bacteroidaceae bacterium]MBP9637453.1 F0F1 ATP synthase subunit B [Bacteroidaceae bacterium]